MSSQSVNILDVETGVHASASEIVSCFEEQRKLLTKLALLITGDESTAMRCVENARQSTLRSQSPFRRWVVEWAKTSTVQFALVRSAQLIRSFEYMNKARQCTHPEHLADSSSYKNRRDPTCLLDAGVTKAMADLDPLSRAVLVLRLALGSSIQECAFRLNVSRRAVLGANCIASEWLAIQRDVDCE